MHNPKKSFLNNIHYLKEISRMVRSKNPTFFSWRSYKVLTTETASKISENLHVRFLITQISLSFSSSSTLEQGVKYVQS